MSWSLNLSRYVQEQGSSDELVTKLIKVMFPSRYHILRPHGQAPRAGGGHPVSLPDWVTKLADSFSYTFTCFCLTGPFNCILFPHKFSLKYLPFFLFYPLALTGLSLSSISTQSLLLNILISLWFSLDPLCLPCRATRVGGGRDPGV